MTRYIWNGSAALTRPTENIKPGDVFEPTESELGAFGDLIKEKAGSSSDNPGGAQGENGTPECTKDGCSRTVKGGGRCWQHPLGEDEE